MQSIDQLLRDAIADRRLVSFTLHGLPRVGEPHDYGVADGVPTLFFYQTGGKSSSDQPIGWRKDQRFAGTRPAPTGRHKKWDQLYATVSTRE